MNGKCESKNSISSRKVEKVYWIIKTIITPKKLLTKPELTREIRNQEVITRTNDFIEEYGLKTGTDLTIV